MAENLTPEIINLDELDNDKRQKAAHAVADYITNIGHEQHKMLALSPEDVLNKMGQVALVNGEVAGYVGASQPAEGPRGKMSEVGSLFVLEKYQRRGIATDLLTAAINGLTKKGAVPYIFCNNNSLPVAESVGFELANTNGVPSCATEACSGCVVMQSGAVRAGQCCDTIMVYGGGGKDDKGN